MTKAVRARDTSFGQSTPLTAVDRFGMALSYRRIRSCLRRFRGAKGSLLDLGCGYHGYLIKELAADFSRLVGVDVAVSADLERDERISVYRESIDKACGHLPDRSFDVIVMNSVLEHLEDPLSVLRECNRLLNDDGLLLVNVPTWPGKFFLELSAYVFHLSPREEVDDHKMYYNKRDLWPLLVRSGFKPRAIVLRYHKFGLNLFAVIGKNQPL
jgi:2-polyprenyl-3-methyl-5-hydroxy-6-metoxy-1,4-benzoquinol methylase